MQAVSSHSQTTGAGGWVAPETLPRRESWSPLSGSLLDVSGTAEEALKRGTLLQRCPACHADGGRAELAQTASQGAYIRSLTAEHGLCKQGGCPLPRTLSAVRAGPAKPSSRFFLMFFRRTTVGQALAACLIVHPPKSRRADNMKRGDPLAQASILHDFSTTTRATFLGDALHCAHVGQKAKLSGRNQMANRCQTAFSYVQ